MEMKNESDADGFGNRKDVACINAGDVLSVFSL